MDFYQTWCGIDIVKSWIGIVNGQILSIFDSSICICLPHNSGRVLSLHSFITKSVDCLSCSYMKIGSSTNQE